MIIEAAVTSEAQNRFIWQRALYSQRRGKAQPREPAQRLNLCSDLLSSIMVPVQMPEWPVSDTTTASLGKNSVISLQIRSGLMGTASELRWAATSARHSLT